MTFLNPLVLLALAAAAIPLIIHLFNFRRPRRVDFSSLTFVKELQRSTMQRVKIKQWLLLALRTLAIACLILAFARPTLEGDMAGVLGGRSSSAIAIVVDTSPSMDLRDAQGSYIEQAQRAASAIVEMMEQDDRVYIFGTSLDSERATSGYNRRGPALEAIQRLQVTPSAVPATRVVQRAARALEESEQLHRELYLISDLQRATLVDTLAAEEPVAAHTFLLPVGERRHDNVAVTDVQVLSRIIEAGQPVEIEATLVNHGSETRTDYTASLYLEDARVAQTTATLEPDLPTTVRFTASADNRGWLGGFVAVEEDAFAWDDRRYFSLHVPEQRRVLLVEGNGQQADYVRLALTAQTRDAGALFEVDTISETALAGTRLADYDAVLMVGPQNFSSGEIRSLAQYMEHGGGVMLFPSAAAQAESYNAFFEEVGGGTFSGFSGSVGSDQPVAGFDEVDLEHPLFEGIFDASTSRTQLSSERVESPDFYYAMNYQPGAGAEHTLVQLSNGFPFLQEIRHGEGTLLVAASTPDPSWSDLPVRGLFVPLMVRSAHFLSAGESVQGESLHLGEAAELRMTRARDGSSFYLHTPNEEAFMPEQRRLPGATLLQLEPSIDALGHYEVREEDDLRRIIVYNLDPRHSNLQTYGAGEAAERLEEALSTPVQVLDGGAQPDRVTRALTAQRSGVELWNFFLLLALVFLVTEMIVARRWQPEAA